MDSRVIRINCPSAELSKADRIELLSQDIKEWIYSESLTKLVHLYGGETPVGLQFKDYISWLNDFVNVWDFRKKQSNGGERWTIIDDAKTAESSQMIFDASYGLGLIDSGAPCNAPDFILPLGGARLANLLRVERAKEMADLYKEKQFSVVALSGKRPINEIELPYLEQYAPNAATEYDAINGGIEKAFGLSADEYRETNFITANINSQWSIREYNEEYAGHKVYSIAAPSSDPGRRANSFDTFDFFMKNFKVKNGQRLLLVTSCIYVPFQLLKFIPLSLESNISVDCVGVPAKQDGSQFSNPSNYLQEIKGTVNAIKNVSDLYF